MSETLAPGELAVWDDGCMRVDTVVRTSTPTPVILWEGPEAQARDAMLRLGGPVLTRPWRTRSDGWDEYSGGWCMRKVEVGCAKIGILL